LSDARTDDGFSKERAELFEALGHPMRLEILRALSESPLGFADLKRKMNVTSSGHLAHHLEKLDGLVRTTPEGLYSLTDEGKEALRIVSVSKESASDKVQNGKRLVISRAVLAGLVAALILLASVAVVQELELTDLWGKQSSQNPPFPITTDFNSSVLQVIGTSLTPVVSQGQNVTVSVEVYNPLEQGIMATADPRGTSLSPCGGPSPVDAEIYLGYYTPNNISEGTPLVLNPEAYCLFSMAFTTVYTFYPHSDMALISSGNDTKNTTEVRGLFSTSGYYTYVLDPTVSAYTAKFQTFAPGTYTTLVSDVWGHVGVCYVQVVQSGYASPLSIGVEGSYINRTTLVYGNASASLPAVEVFPLFITSVANATVHLSLVGARDGVWAKFMPDNLSVGPGGASASLVVAGAVTPGGGVSSDRFTVTVVASDGAGHSSNVSEVLVPVAYVAVLHSDSQIDLRVPGLSVISAFPDTDQVITYGAVFDPLISDYAIGVPLSLLTMSVSLQPLGILVNGSLEPTPSWLRVIIPDQSFNLSAYAPHYFPVGLKLSSAPLGNFTIAIGETVGLHSYVAYINYTVVPTPHL
jgi:DNA-binding HxlR family transcriptional regulator